MKLDNGIAAWRRFGIVTVVAWGVVYKGTEPTIGTAQQKLLGTLPSRFCPYANVAISKTTPSYYGYVASNGGVILSTIPAANTNMFFATTYIASR